MATAFVECWKCDVCGFRWIKTETWPERCPSRKCRTRQWNQSAGASGAVVATKLPSPVRTPIATTAVEPVKLATKMNDAMANFLKAARPVIPEVSVAEEAVALEVCRHTEWAEDGEQYRCRLVAGHKGKCVPGERVS